MRKTNILENQEEIEEYFKNRKNYRDIGIVFKSNLLKELIEM